MLFLIGAGAFVVVKSYVFDEENKEGEIALYHCQHLLDKDLLLQIQHSRACTLVFD